MCSEFPLVIPHVYFPRYGSPPMVRSVSSRQKPSAFSAVYYLTPGGLGLPQRLPYVVLPLASSILCIST